MKNSDNLYIDSNSIIYDCVNDLTKENYKIDNYENILIQLIIKRLQTLISFVSPKQKCFIAFDGVAPLAKLNQQRCRRFKSSYEKNITEAIGETNDGIKWDTTAITPGTNFMKNLSAHIYNFFSGINSHITFHISCSDEVGEGEHKIFEFIRNNVDYHKNSNTTIYGLDADLIMLSLSHSSLCKNIFLYRDTPVFISQIDRNLDPNKSYLLNISLLENTINEDFDGTDRIQDYIFLCFMLGNDFMPHIPCINIRTDGINILLNYYNSTIVSKKMYLIVNGKIKWKNVRTLIESLSEEEHMRLKSEYNKRSRFKLHKHTKQEKLLLLPMLNRTDEHYINPNEFKWQRRYYKSLFNIDMPYNNNNLKNICINYIEGLEWTFNYYTKGCLDWRWEYKYNYAPLLKDLYTFISYHDIDYLDINHTNPVSPYTQLAYVLPETSHYLLNSSIRNLINTKYKYYYNSNNFQWAFCKFFWESKLTFKYININELENDIKIIGV
jgi:5'-3' exonuclease